MARQFGFRDRVDRREMFLHLFGRGMETSIRVQPISDRQQPGILIDTIPERQPACSEYAIYGRSGRESVIANRSMTNGGHLGLEYARVPQDIWTEYPEG